MNRTARDRVTGFLLKYATAIIFIVIFVYFGLSAANFFSTENTLNIVKQASFVGVIAVGMTFVLLTGGIDLSVGSNMYLSAMTVGYLLQLPGFQGGFGVLAGIVVGLATGAAFGAINAFCVVVLRITPFLVTLATMVAGHGLVTAITESYGIDYPLAFTAFGAMSVLGVPIPIIVFVFVVGLAHVVLTRTGFGRRLYAVGNDAEAARKAGIDTDRIVFAVYVICGVGSALGGVMLIAFVGGTSLFGGVGGAFGAVVGSVLVQMVQAGMVFVKVNLYLQPMVLAGIIFIAVFFDSLREARLTRLKRRFIRVDVPNRQDESGNKV
jgi:ribose transport system permease protein